MPKEKDGITFWRGYSWRNQSLDNTEGKKKNAEEHGKREISTTN